MKQFLKSLLVAVMCISLAGTAFAAPSSPGHKPSSGGGNVTVKPSEPETKPEEEKKDDVVIVPGQKPSETPGEETPGEEGAGTEDWIIGTIVEQDGKETDLGYDEHKDDIIITPAENAEESTKLSQEHKQNIKNAYNNLANIVQQNMLGSIPGLDQKVKDSTNGKKTAEDLVITNVINVSTQGAALEGLMQDGAGLRLNLNVGSPEDGFTTVLVERDGEWVELENTVVNEDGTVTCVLQEGDTIAIVKEGQTKSGSLLNRVVNTVKNVVKNAINSLFGLF